MRKVIITDIVGRRIINLLSNRTIRFLVNDISIASAKSIKTNTLSAPSVKLLDIVVIVPVTGDLQANFVMSFEDKFARSIVAAYITHPIPEKEFDDYLTDGVGEIANLIIANSVGNLPAELSKTEIQTPHVFHNSGAELKQQNLEILTCHINTPAGKCNLSLQI